MEVARTSMIHAAAPHFLWSFAVRYAVHQRNLWPRVSLPETSPTLRWTGKVGDALVFRVWGSRAFTSADTSADKLSSRAIPCVFLGFPPAAPSWQFFHPTSRRVLSFQDATFYESGAEPVGAEPKGAESDGAGSGDAEPGGAKPGGAEPGGAESEGAESGGIEPRGTASAGGPAGALPRLSPQREPLSPHQLREWFSQRTHLRSGAAGTGGSATRGTGAGGAGVTTRAGGTGGAGAASPGGARTRDTGAVGANVVGAGDSTGGTSTGGAGVGGAGAGDPGAKGTGAGGTGAIDPGVGGAGAGGAGAGGTGAGGTVQRRPFFVPPPPSSLLSPNPVLRQVLISSSLSCLRCSHWSSSVPRPRPPPVPSTHIMALRPSSVPLRVPLPPPLASSLPVGPDPESDLARAASPTIPRLLATVVTYPSFESAAASALVVELVDLTAAYRLDYATSLVAESKFD
ncbi:unnamed protein product [Closterium sp. NIES-53]